MTLTFDLRSQPVGLILKQPTTLRNLVLLLYSYSYYGPAVNHNMWEKLVQVCFSIWRYGLFNLWLIKKPCSIKCQKWPTVFSKSAAQLAQTEKKEKQQLISLAFSWPKANILCPLSANKCYQHPVFYKEHVPVTESQWGHKDMKSTVCLINGNLHQNFYVEPASTVVPFWVLCSPEALNEFSSQPTKAFFMPNFHSAEARPPAASSGASAAGGSLSSNLPIQPLAVVPKRKANVVEEWLEVCSSTKEEFRKLHEDFGKEVKELIADWSKKGRADEAGGENLIDFG